MSRALLSYLEIIPLPGAVLSYVDKKVPKEPTQGGAEILLPQEQAPSPIYPSRSALLLERKMFRCDMGAPIISYRTLYITFSKKKSR